MILKKKAQIYIDLGFDTFIYKTFHCDHVLPCIIGEKFSFDIVKSQSRNLFLSGSQKFWEIKPLNFFWERDYFYNCFVDQVYDGDTITRAKIDLGFGIIRTSKIRLYGINCPEIRNGGIEARDFLRSLVLNKNIQIKTYFDKKGKYGRHLATVFVNGVDINSKMLSLGLAQSYVV